MNKIKKYIDDNVSLRVTDFQLLDVSFYGCDARFEFEFRDKETGVVLNTYMETVENAFMGVDDGDEIYTFEYMDETLTEKIASFFKFSTNCYYKYP